MIAVSLAPEPANFDQKVRRRGHLALEVLCGQVKPQGLRRDIPQKSLAGIRRIEDIPVRNLPTYWRDAIPELLKAYREICAYCCVRINAVTGARTVDHFIPKSIDRRKAYDWNNFRLACGEMNSNKGIQTVLDPFDPITGWFELELVGFQVKPNPVLGLSEQRAVLETIQILKLNDETLTTLRASHAQGYWELHYSFQHLQRESPFVALELKRQGRILPGD